MVIVDVEKVKGLSNYYVSVVTDDSVCASLTHTTHTHTHTQLYIVQVTCKNRSSYAIRRRYRQFDDLQNSLEKRFPIEAGDIRSKDRTLPTLPGVCVWGGALLVQDQVQGWALINRQGGPEKYEYR